MATLPRSALKRRIRALLPRLEAAYGPFEVPRSDPVEESVLTLLSHNTNDRLRDLAYARLRERFPTWEEVRTAPYAEVVEAVAVCGLGPAKAANIQAFLQGLHDEVGAYTLDFLKGKSYEEADAWLSRFAGMGPKTRAVVLLFSTLDLPAFPVDTHIHRIAGRLGLIGPKVGREEAHEILRPAVPDEKKYSFHVGLIQHGRLTCTARLAKCGSCPVAGLCEKNGVGPDGRPR
ncbi:MAG TPA: endonuclease III [Candidatus Thermoplasmatota archaeon]|nr:endonuclease III [Candidatus Thermoplasmatota archaeon]